MSMEWNPGSHPDDMRLTQDAFQVLAQARSESDRLGHDYVGTEHLVLALLDRDAGTTARVLARLGIDRRQVRESLNAIVRRGGGRLAMGAERPYTSRTRQAFRLARDSMRDLGNVDVGEGHLLLGVMREAMGPGAQILRHWGLTSELAFEEVRRIHGDSTSS